MTKYTPNLYQRILILFVLILMNAVNTNLFAQTESTKKQEESPKNTEHKWTITLNGASTLMWNELTQEYGEPLSKYFREGQHGWAGGLMVTRKFGKSFNANLQYMGGFFQGHKDTWSNGTAADVGFHTKFHNFNLNVEFDILNFFNNKERRLFAPFVMAGLGYGLSNSTASVYSTGAEIASAKTSYFEFPWGFGLRSDITDNISLRFEYSIHSAFNDLADGYQSPSSTENDIFTFTTIGVSYKIHQKKKKKRMELEIEEPQTMEEDSAIAVVEVVKPAFKLSITSNTPTYMYPNDTTDIVIKINKNDIKGEAKIQQSLPDGFIVIAKENDGAEFNFENQILTYNWDELPSKNDVSIHYQLISNAVEEKPQNISGVLFYTQDSIDKIQQFNKTISIIQASPAVVTDTMPKETVVAAVAVVEKPKGKLRYRVQVYAVYGGTTSAKLIKKRLKLKHEVKQSYDGKYAKYTSGEFNTYNEANAYKKELRGSTVPGAFVVGYYDGEREHNIKDAIALEKGTTVAAVVAPVATKGIEYRIQILATKKNLSDKQVRSITGTVKSFNKVQHNSLYKYEIGNYKSYSEAKAALKEVRKNVSDAYIVKYRDGVRK